MSPFTPDQFKYSFTAKYIGLLRQVSSRLPFSILNEILLHEISGHDVFENAILYSTLAVASIAVKRKKAFCTGEPGQEYINKVFNCGNRKRINNKRGTRRVGKKVKKSRYYGPIPRLV
jgi:hypothetical protein